MVYIHLSKSWLAELPLACAGETYQVPMEELVRPPALLKNEEKKGSNCASESTTSANFYIIRVTICLPFGVASGLDLELPCLEVLSSKSLASKSKGFAF